MQLPLSPARRRECSGQDQASNAEVSPPLVGSEVPRHRTSLRQQVLVQFKSSGSRSCPPCRSLLLSSAVGHVALVVGVRVGVVEDLLLGNVGVHPLLPLLRPQLRLQVVDGRLDERSCTLEVDADETVVTLHDATVDDNRVDVTTNGCINLTVRRGG